MFKQVTLQGIKLHSRIGEKTWQQHCFVTILLDLQYVYQDSSTLFDIDTLQTILTQYLQTHIFSNAALCAEAIFAHLIEHHHLSLTELTLTLPSPALQCQAIRIHLTQHS